MISYRWPDTSVLQQNYTISILDISCLLKLPVRLSDLILFAIPNIVVQTALTKVHFLYQASVLLPFYWLVSQWSLDCTNLHASVGQMVLSITILLKRLPISFLVMCLPVHRCRHIFGAACASANSSSSFHLSCLPTDFLSFAGDFNVCTFKSWK